MAKKRTSPRAISVPVPSELHQAVMVAAKRDQRTVAQWCRLALRAMAEREKQQEE